MVIVAILMAGLLAMAIIAMFSGHLPRLVALAFYFMFIASALVLLVYVGLEEALHR